MAGEFTYDPGLVFADDTLLPSANSVGILVATAESVTPLPIYDLQGNALANLSTNNRGYVGRFRADVSDGVLKFGTLLQPVASVEQQRAGLSAKQDALNAVAAASEAQRAAESAASDAASAAAAIKNGSVTSVAGQTGEVTTDELRVALDPHFLTQAEGDGRYIRTVNTRPADADGNVTVAGGAASVVPVSALPSGSLLVVLKDAATGFWPASYGADGSPVYTGGSATAAKRPTARSDIRVAWQGTGGDPATVTSGDGGMRPGDVRWRY